jgi:hypothetical protein
MEIIVNKTTNGYLNERYFVQICTQKPMRVFSGVEYVIF